MDGVLLDSEPVWQETEVEVFGRLGVELTLEMCTQTMGLRYDEVVRYWFRRKPWQGQSPEQVAEDLLAAMIPQLEQRAASLCMPGVRESLTRISDLGLPIALATSSPTRLIDVILNALNITEFFHSSHSAEHQVHGKPHPSVFMAAADALGVPASQCVAIEDSVNGVISAKAANMRCVAVPTAQAFGDPRFSIADHSIRSLLELGPEHLQRH